MNKYKLTLAAMFAALLTACVNFSGTVVTITSVVDSASKSYAHEYNLGRIPEDVDKKIEIAHLQYRNACTLTQQALIAYKNNGDKGSYIQALEMTRVAAQSIIDLITPYLDKTQTQNLNKQLAVATKL